MSRQSFADFYHAQSSARAGVGFLRIVLLFGSAAVSLGLILIPLLMQRVDRQYNDTLFFSPPDKIVTGTIKPDNKLHLPLNSSVALH